MCGGGGRKIYESSVMFRIKKWGTVTSLEKLHRGSKSENKERSIWEIVS